VHKRIISAIKKVEFVSNRILYIIILNVHASIEDKIDVKSSFYKISECVFSKFPKYYTQTLFGDLKPKVYREEIFKPIIENESLHKISNNNEVSPNIQAGRLTPLPGCGKSYGELAVSKHDMQRFHMETFNIKKLNEVSYTCNRQWRPIWF
jgi:hypothetical protein